MAMVVILYPVSDEEPRLQRAALEKLARLGITSVALLRDTSLAGLVLEGWAFDPRDAPQAVSAVAGPREDVQTLVPLAQMAVSAAPSREVSSET
ncbi:MAG TPA: hypothetical protein VMT59_10725 [Gaiellaceae bacterium]|nr:hypothetical protein [Gaiellaceae bacterium]